MAQNEFVAVRCTLSKGIFSTERAFEVTLANGKKYSGPAPIHFCWNDEGKLLGKDEAIDEDIEGWVAGRLYWDQPPGDQVKVRFPDGALLTVHQSQVREALTEILPPTPTRR